MSLEDNLYEVSLVAFDQEGVASELSIELIRIGPEPANQPPSLSNTEVIVTGDCVAVAGRVLDINNDIASVTVQIDQGMQQPSVLNGTEYTYSQCGIAGGEHQLTITASDMAGLSAVEISSFVVDAGVIAVLQAHIDAGRLDFTAYASCFLEYGSTNPFRLDEVQVNETQCQWSDGMACAGPAQSCSGSDSPPQPPPNSGACNEVSAYNYYHKLAGRAYSEGAVLAPDYFAQGSNDALPGSTWGLNTVHQLDDDSIWSLGSCP